MGKQSNGTNKPHLTIGMIGNPGNGKSPLAAAMTKILALKGLATFSTYEQIHNAPRENIDGITISAARLSGQTDHNRLTLIDCSSHDDYLKCTISGSYPLDGAILVLSAIDKVRPKTREQLILAGQAKVTYIVVYLNKINLAADPQQIDLLEMEIRSWLSAYGFPEDEIVIIRGDALRALTCNSDDVSAPDYRSIHELLHTIDSYIPPTQQNGGHPFLMPIENAYDKDGQGLIICGRIERGFVAVNQTVEIVGFRDSRDAVVTDIQMFRKHLTTAEVGDSIEIGLRGLSAFDAARGQVLASPRSIRSHEKFEAHVYLLRREEGGLRIPLMPNDRLMIYFHNTDIQGTCTFEEHSYCMSGEDMLMIIELTVPVAMEKCMSFRIREGGNVIGLGIVTRVL
jgi:elongation factor Tu